MKLKNSWKLVAATPWSTGNWELATVLAARCEAYNGSMKDADLVIVHTFNNQPEAEIAKSALEAAGIDTMIQADTAGGMRPHLASTGAGYKLLIRKKDATAARKILERPSKPRK